MVHTVAVAVIFSETGSNTTRKIHHDDVVGEDVSPEEAEEHRKLILESMVGDPSMFRRFPGSQPVSLDRTNLLLLKSKRYICKIQTTQDNDIVNQK